MSNILLSIIIPCRNEFPNVVHTFYSIMHSVEASGIDPKSVEVVLVNNCSTDTFYPQRGTKGTTDYLMTRGGFWARTIRMIYDPIAGNHSARNKGAEIARGEYLFFSDAHMAYSPYFFKYMLEAVKESGGIVHAPIGWMGAYPPASTNMGYQYTIKLGEEIKGTWNNYCLDEKKWFYIPALGHCSLIVRRDQFLDFGGYPKVHRCYGGGEFYVNMKWWMFGSSVAVEPRAFAYHLASGRGYSYNHDDYLHNVLNVALALDMYDWGERAYINCLRKGNPKVLKRMWEEAERETQEDREFIRKRRVKTFNEVIVEQPWNVQNQERLGKSNGCMTIFHDTWLPLLEQSPAAKEAYENSVYQKDLEKFINEKLARYVYKR